MLGPDGTVYEGISTNNNPNQPNQFSSLNADGSLKWLKVKAPVPSISDAHFHDRRGAGEERALPGLQRRGKVSGTTCALDAEQRVSSFGNRPIRISPRTIHSRPSSPAAQCTTIATTTTSVATGCNRKGQSNTAFVGPSA